MLLESLCITIFYVLYFSSVDIHYPNKTTILLLDTFFNLYFYHNWCFFHYRPSYLNVNILINDPFRHIFSHSISKRKRTDHLNNEYFDMYYKKIFPFPIVEANSINGPTNDLTVIVLSIYSHIYMYSGLSKQLCTNLLRRMQTGVFRNRL